MKSEQIIQVRSLGLDEHFRSMLNVFFARNCDRNYQLTDREEKLVVVDLDAMGARDAYTEYREMHTALPTILFSLNENEYSTGNNIILLRKPFTVRQLLAALQILYLRFLHRPQSGRKKINETSTSDPHANKIGARKQGLKKTSSNNSQEFSTSIKPHQRRTSPTQALPKLKETENNPGTYNAAFSLSKHDEYLKLNSIDTGTEEESEYQPDHYLQSKLVAAYRKASTAHKVAVVKIRGGSITMDPEQNLVKMGMGGFQLREAASFPLNLTSVDVSLVTAESANIDEKSIRAANSLQGLIWKTTIYASRGRVPVGTDMDSQIQLKCWPNLTRLVLMPDVVRISALWIAQPRSITEIVKLSGASERDVASFYSAAQAVELFHPAKETKATENIKLPQEFEKPKTQVSPKARAGGGLLTKILRHLRAG